MKKVLALFFALALTLSLVSLAGCGSSKSGEIPADSPYIGTWEATRAELKGETADMNDFLEDGKWTITLNADGTVQQTSGTETETGVWSITNDGLSMKLDGAKKAVKFTAEGDELATKIIATIYFVKQS